MFNIWYVGWWLVVREGKEDKNLKNIKNISEKRLWVYIYGVVEVCAGREFCFFGMKELSFFVVYMSYEIF